MTSLKDSDKGLQGLIIGAIEKILDQSLSESNLGESFYELGGNSILAVRLRSTCEKKGINLQVSAIISSPTIHHLIESATLTAPVHPEGLSSLTDTSAYDSVSTMSSEDNLSTALNSVSQPTSDLTPASSVSTPTINCNTEPMTNMQQLLLNGSQRFPEINIITYREEYKLSHLAHMKKAWQTVVKSEPIFRMQFDIQSKTQTETDIAPFMWTETTVATHEEYEVHSMKPNSDSYNSFTVTILQTPGSPICAITWHIHHALIDGYSRDIILDKVRRVAAGETISQGHSFLSLVRELNHFRAENQESAQKFWQKQQEEHPSANGIILLPAPSKNHLESHHTKTITTSLRNSDIHSSAAHSGTTFASLMHAAWTLVLSKYIHSDSIEFGTIMSGRTVPLLNVSKTVGPMINSLPFRFRICKDMTTRNFLCDISHKVVGLLSFEWSTPEDGFERQFSSALAVEGIVEPGIQTNSSVVPINKPQENIDSDVPLSVMVRTDGDVRFQYHVNAFHERDVKFMAHMFCHAVEALLLSERSIGDVLDSLVDVETRHYLLSLGNCFSPLTSPGSVKQDLVTLFESGAKQYPVAVACQQGDRKITYEELDIAATKVASFLICFVQPGEVVCLRPSSSFDWIIGIYGILKARAVYSPLDGSLPLSIQNDNFTTASARILLTTDDSGPPQTWKPTNCSISCSILDIISSSTVANIQVEHCSKPEPSTNAYLCFTSGSSGKPKGVICTHEGLVAFQRDETVRLFAARGRRISQIMSPAFDGSIHEIFSALSYGATLVLKDSANPFDVLRSVDSAILTPSIANVLDPSDYPELKAVYLVGEPVPEAVSAKWASQKSLYNMYGPTEATCGATIKQLRSNEPITLGVPGPSMRIYILDQNRTLVPPGVTGEICLAGIQVARGYVGRTEETARSFVPDTILPDRREFMYCTGDLGYWDNNGELVCLGRADRQIKLRGFRLNLNDLETRVCQHIPELKAVAITGKEDALIAMVVPVTLNIDELRLKMAKVLPVYAMPRHVIAVDSFPKTNAGKLDYKAVVEMAPSNETKSLSERPSIVDTIASMWRKILNLSPDFRLSQNSDFKELGGDSIKQIQLVSFLRQHFGHTIPLHMVMKNSTLRKLAQSISQIDKNSENHGPLSRRHASRLGDQALSPLESEWYHKSISTSFSSAFNVTYACEIEANIDRVRLARAWNTVLARHRVLSSRFVKHYNGTLLRQYGTHPPRTLRYHKLDLRREINRPFRLDSENLIRVIISRDRMLIVAHHIICDLPSLRVLIRDMAQVYNGGILCSETRQYAETTIWNELVMDEVSNFWHDYLGAKIRNHRKSGINGISDEPLSAPRQDYEGCSLVMKMCTSLYRDMIAFVESQNMTLHQLAQAAVALVTQSDREDIDIILGAPFMNRSSAEDVDVVGLYLEPLPVRIQYTRGCSPSSISFLQKVARSNKQAFLHAMPWNKLLAHLSIEPSFPTHPLFDKMVTFLEQGQMPTKSPLPGLNPLYIWAEGAKFKLMVEFLAVSDETLLLRCEYDTSYYNEAEIRIFQKRLAVALRGFVSGTEYDKIRELVQIDDFMDSHQTTTEEARLMFGWRMDML